MIKKILTMPGCSKCQQLKMEHPEIEAVEIDQETLLKFARAVGIASMPMVVCAGDDLDTIL